VTRQQAQPGLRVAQAGEPHRAPRLFPASLRLSRAAPTSNQLQSLEACVAVLADDDVIVHADAERSGDRDDLADASRDRLAARCGLGHTAAQGTALSRGLKSGPIRF
jgi:hypothetical protein